MPAKTKISDATRVDEIRTWLGKAAVETDKLSREAYDATFRKGLKKVKKKQHASRYRLAKQLAKAMDALRDAMWELPGIKWH